MAERKSGPGMRRYPYEPDMEHCRMVVKTGGAVCYIMDDCCRDMTAEDKAAADRRIVDIYLGAMLRAGSRKECTQ